MIRTRTAGIGAVAASREKIRQASVENRSACCLYSCIAMLPVTEGLVVAALGTHLVLLVLLLGKSHSVCAESRRWRKNGCKSTRGGRPSQAIWTGGLWKTFTANQIDPLDNTETEKMYARYKDRLGVAMTKTLRSATLQLYVEVAAMFLPIENQSGIIADLESDPFVRHTLSSATCELYHPDGMF